MAADSVARSLLCGVRSMWKLHRYYLRELTATLLLTFAVLFGVVLLSTLNRGIDRAQGFGLVAAVKVTFYWAADTLPHLFAMSLLFATVLTFARASQEREITAIRSAGLSPRVAMAPAMLLGVGLSLVGGWAQHYALPWVHYQKYHVITAAVRNVLLQTGLANDKLQFGSFVMTWDRQREDRTWEGVTIKIGEGHDVEKLTSGIWIADTASLVMLANQEELELTLTNPRQPTSNVAFERVVTTMNIRTISESGRRYESDRDLSSDHLLAEVERGQNDNPNGARFTVHRRSCFALMPFLFAPIGFCIGVLARERGRVLALVFAMVPLAIYYITDVCAARLVRDVDWPPIAWLPAAVLIALGVPFCWRLLRL